MVSLVPVAALARPISFPGGTMLMSMNDHVMYSQSASYSFTAKDAVGLNSFYMRHDGDWFHTATYNRLLKRWNAEDSQANVYVMTGLGMAQHGDDENAAGTLGMEADWETRRYYLSYENRYMAAGSIESSFYQKARVGIAPYEAGYDELSTWLMLQVDYHPTDRDNVVITPFVRVFNTVALGEVGISNRGDVMFNATVQF